MHGRKQKDRAEQAKESDEVKEAKRNKFKKLRGLLQTALDCRRMGDYSQNTMDLASQLLVINPSINTLWSLRRDGLMYNLRKHDDDATRKNTVKTELALNGQALLKGNVKSHEAWSHRAWIVETLGCSGTHVDIPSELALCEKFLMADERNFHCYQYRKLLTKLSGHTPQDELKFAQKLVERNFSNYSAWHLKIKAFEELESLDSDILKLEFELVNNALFTEPDDQSGWMYHRWLVDNLEADKHAELLEEQLCLCKELNQMEDDSSKWAIVSLIHLHLKKRELSVSVVEPLISKLIEIDPAHHRYYQYLLNTIIARESTQ